MVEPAGTIQPTLSTLPERPPTPPKESSRNESKGSFIKRFFLGDSASKQNSLTNITPESSAESPIASPNTSATARKKVGWSNSTQYSEDPRASLDGNPRITVLPLTPSAERKPTKSILKSYNGGQERAFNPDIHGPLHPPHQYKTFADMLEAIVTQLAGNQREGMMDAYLMLSGSLKASDSSPDIKALKDKMGLLLQFITRDVTVKAENGKPDTPLVINALLLLSSMLPLPGVGEAIGNDFGIFIVDHSITIFEDPNMSKDIVKHLMHVLSQQKFSQRVMNADRIGKLIENLHNIESFVKGKSIVVGRIMLYRNLLRQSKIHMITHLLWLEDLFSDMLSNVKAIRTEAITFGLESSYHLGVESKVSRAVSNLFQIEQPEGGKKFAEYYSERLMTAVQKKQEMMTNVPQICSVLFFFLRGKPKQLEGWKSMSKYLAIFQQCFNSGDVPTRIEANYAWNRFVVAIQPDENTKKSTISMLAQPLHGQLKLRRSAKTRTSAIGSVCSLLYYTLRPSSTPHQLDLFWNQYVVSIIGQALTPTKVDDPNTKEDPLRREEARKILADAKEDLSHACTILRYLFDSSFQRPWNENRVTFMIKEKGNSVAAEELPALDAKWLRKSSKKHIFPVILPIMEKLYWELAESSKISKLWQTYIRSVSTPAIMEVKVSNDTMSCLASIFELFYKIWRAGPNNIATLPTQDGPSNARFLQSFAKLVTTTTATTTGLGILPFTQRDLCIGTQDQFEPVATPSQRQNRLQGEIRKPFHHLFCLLATDSPQLVHDDNFMQMGRSILQPFFEPYQSSRSECIKLASELLSLLPTEGSPATKALWQVVAEFVTNVVKNQDSDKTGNSDQPLGKYYQSVIKILDAGIRYSPQEALQGWEELFQALAKSAIVDSGVSGKAIVVIEPLAKFLLLHEQNATDSFSSVGISYYTLLVAKTEYPKDRQALDAAKKRLWGSAMAGPKVSTFDPFAKLYEYVQATLASSYTNFDNKQEYSDKELQAYSDMIKATNVFIVHCPADLLFGSLVKVQEGISHWVLDTARKLGNGNSLSKQITSFWDAFCNLIPRLEELYGCSKILAELEALICSGINSSHKSIASRAVKMWNTTFGLSEEAFEYPERAQTSLLRIRTVADIQLPFIPESVLSEAAVAYGQQPIQYADTQDDSSAFLPTTSLELAMKNHRTPQGGSSPMTRKMRETTPEVVIQMSAASSRRKRPREETPEVSGKRKSRRKQSTPKLRHDDSQVQFQAIESSPITNGAATSQLLTDRQKEVKDRQLADAAMFLDLNPSSDHAETQNENEQEPQLPLRRPSSKARSTASPRVQVRQTTPTPLPPSEDDNFMVSSPTPKRSSRLTAGGLSDSASPALVAPVSEKDEPIPQIEISPIEEVPSSPPVVPGLQNAGPISSVEYPSAQVETYAVHPKSAMSTFGSAAAQDATPTRSNPLGVSEEALQDAIMEDGGIEANENFDSRGLPMEIDEVFRPSTPTRSDLPKSSRYGTSSPPFVDARSGPVSDDSLTGNEEVFEDAVTSPRLVVLKRGSSVRIPPGVDADESMDESSLIRMMQNFDEEHQRSSLATVPDTNSPRRSTRGNSRRATLQEVSTNSPAAGLIRKTALKNAAASSLPNSRQKSPITQDQRTPSKYLVPEIQVHRTRSSSRFNAVEESAEVDVATMIVVDISGLKEMERSPSPSKESSSTRTRSSRKRQSLLVANQQVDDASGNDSEIPESQEVQGSFPSPTKSPKKKSPRKKRGRPRKSMPPSSVPASQESSVQIDEAVKSMRTPSIDLDAPLDLGLDVEMTGRNEKGVEGHVVVEALADMQQLLKGIDGFAKKEEHVELEDDAEYASSPEVQVVEQAIVGDGASAANGSAEPTGQSPILAPDTVVEVEAQAEAPIHQLEEEASKEVTPAIVNAVPARPAVSEENATFDAVKRQLENLVGNLDLAKLTKEQISEVEDMLMDVKEKLYGAARSRRKAGL